MAVAYESHYCAGNAVKQLYRGARLYYYAMGFKMQDYPRQQGHEEEEE